MITQSQSRFHLNPATKLLSIESFAEAALKSISLERKNFPLTIYYGEKTYILVLTKSGKLLLQKPFEDMYG